MESVSELDRARVVFEYWMRTILSNQKISVQNYAGLVVKYYFIFQFEWDPQRKHEALIISNEGMRVTDTSSVLGWRSLCAKKVLPFENASTCNVRWEITLRQKGEDTSVLIGFINAECIEDFCVDVKLGDGNDIGTFLWIWDGCYPTINKMATAPRFTRTGRGTPKLVTNGFWNLISKKGNVMHFETLVALFLLHQV